MLSRPSPSHGRSRFKGWIFLGPFPVQWGAEYLCVTVDKFTKWVEVIPVAEITASTAIKFF